MSDPTPESNRATRPGRSSDGAKAATLTGQHRAFDEAASKLVAAWDTDLDAQTPSEGVPPVSLQAEGFPPAPAASAWLEPDGAAPRSRPSGKALLLGGATCAALVIGWLAMSGDESTTEAVEPSGSADVVAEPEPTPAPTPSAPAEDEAPQPQPEPRFSLIVRTVPPDAELRIDGEEVPNPYEGQHEAEHAMKITATAEGHESAEREVALDEDVHLMLTLTPREKPEARERERARKRAAAKRRRARARREKQARKQQAVRKAKRQRAKDQAPGFIRNNPYD